MIEVLITLYVKAMVGTVVGAVKEEILEIPLNVADQIVAGWDGEGGLQLEKVRDWLKLTEDAASTRDAVKAALKSKGVGDWTWDTLELVKAVAGTGQSLSNIMNKPQAVESRARNERTQPTIYIAARPKPKLLRHRKPAKKRPTSRRKREPDVIHAQIIRLR